MNSLPAKLDLTGAEICGELDEQNPPIHLPNQASDAPLLALDIGGTLIKIVYFKENKEEGKNGNCAVGGKLRFVKFERRRLDECLEFIQSKKLIYRNGATGLHKGHVTVKASGGGAYKFADIFRDKLGVYLDKMDEMESVVTGANFLLQRIKDSAFTHLNGKRAPIDINPKNLFPYLLVNIGSGVSIIKVTGNRKFERVTGTQIGGGTMFGLAKLLTGCMSYNEFLKLSQKGDNVVLDLIVRDICGELVCQKQGLSASTLASSFGKVIASKKTLADFKKEDIAATLLSAFTYNIAQISFLVASLLGLRRVFFGGSYIRGHMSTMDNIAYALDFWSKGQMQAVFLQHEGFLGAVGALTSYEKLESNNFTSSEELVEQVSSQEPSVPVDGKVTAENGDHNIFPYLLVNIGSGVSMIEVIGKGKFERIIGSHLGGGTILGLARLLTGVSSYEQFLELSQRGNNLSVDLTVGDIYGEHGYPKIGLPATTTASSFGKVNSNKLSEYRPEDLAAALLNLFTYNVGQIAYFVANLSGLKRIFFRGAYVCGHEKTMEKISKSLKYWSKGQVQTTFLCHEGFLGTLGAFWSYENMGIDGLAEHEVIREVLLGAPYTGGQFPSIPPTEQCDSDNNSDLKLEAEKLRKENTLLQEEIERLRRENEQLTVKLTSQSNGNLKLH